VSVVIQAAGIRRCEPISKMDGEQGHCQPVRLSHAATEKGSMSGFKGQDLNERLERAAKARQAILEKFKSRPAADDPDVIKRREERLAIAEARKIRDAEKAVRKAKEAEERAARDAIEKVEREARERRAAVEKVIRDAAEAAERKADRDRRYAARKARQASGR
jgi:Family of unknown function (DUF6481)